MYHGWVCRCIYKAIYNNVVVWQEYRILVYQRLEFVKVILQVGICLLMRVKHAFLFLAILFPPGIIFLSGTMEFYEII